MKIKNNNRITLKWWNDNPPNKSGYVYNDIDDESHNHSSLKKLGQLEDIEESMGVGLIAFLSELLFVLKNCNDTVGYTTDRKPILADYGYVLDFINRLKEAIN